MEIQPTSFRLHPATLDLIDAWAKYQSVKKRRNIHRPEVLELMLERIAPPDDMTPEALAVRDSHAAFKATR